jgi:hypothetical protein
MRKREREREKEKEKENERERERRRGNIYGRRKLLNSSKRERER